MVHKAYFVLTLFFFLEFEIKVETCSCSDTVRLVDGSTTNEGHIELFHDGQWKTFCDDEIYYDETLLQGGKTAAVVCRSLGYTNGFESYSHSSPYGNDGGHTWLDNVRCEGTESRLEDCTFLGPCRDEFLVGIVCRGEIDCCDKPKVLPELQHMRTGELGNVLTPILQFKCSLPSNETSLYFVKWYVDDKFILIKGPSNLTADLVLTEYELPKRELGFYVKCGTIIINETGVESNETISNQFYAGFKVSQPDVTVTKGGYNTVTVTQTVPIGCQYSANDSDSPDCSTSVSLFDDNLSQNPCDAGVSVVNADDDDKCVNEILAQKTETFMDSDIVYKFRIATVDKNYDDASQFDLRLQVGENANLGLGQSYVVDNTVHVNVISTDNYQNKMCYSHVDPHMKTCDGNHYENQRPGFYMLFHHKEADIEVQEATKYCFGGKSGPVCTCGIAVRAGGDVFMINRCGSINLLDFLHCGDGGIIHVERVNDHKYKIFTPTRTKIVANLHGGSYANTMNIDIYISAKDFGKTEGLCGLCDDNPSNDFVLKNGSTSYNGNADYSFSESWRLPDNLNLFTFSKRILEKWAVKNEVTCRCVDGKCNVQRQRECGAETVESITKKKCDIQNRKRRDLGEYNHQKEIDRLYSLMLTPRKNIVKRSVGQSSVSAEEAQAICNQSVYSSPAVTDFPDKTANEDPEEVVKQCVYDVEESNDKSWANVHVEAINTIATNILELNPVYVANKTEEVVAFMKQTCINNCSGNGICTDTGNCNCSTWYRGPDCSYDLRVPVVIEDIQGGGECDKANSSDCSCFTIRTDNIFDGFFCQTTITRIDNNKDEFTLVDEYKETGGYEDIFTGTCCITSEQEDLASEMKETIHVYKFSASNDGHNFGEPQTVYVYDSTCHDISINGTNSYITLKENYCFIEGQCFYEGEVSLTSCMFCNSTENARGWTEYNHCMNGGTCAYRDDEHTCDCVEGYTGSTCETDIDECLSLPCKSNGTCNDVLNGYTCNCTAGFEGQNCEREVDECAEDPCGVGGECTDKVNGYSCNCKQGYTGDDCETDIDECLSQPCQNGGSCVDQINGYKCTCVAGYEDTTCSTEIDECLSDPCQHGNCTDDLARYICTCFEGYEGDNCEIDINDCASIPCQHESTCKDLVSSYECICADGYKGTQCEIDIDECESSPCLNEAECVDGIGEYSCTCKNGYSGTHCETNIDECQSSPCQNEAKCIDDVNRYSCSCKAGFSGSHCETNIDECHSSPCQNDAECVDGINRYSCTCKDGYTGIHCETDIDECKSSPCLNEAECIDGIGEYSCTCKNGYSGTQCETNIDECQSSPCQNEAKCIDDVNRYSCSCKAGFSGIHCETNIDECHSSPCQNDAECVDGINRYSCTCKDGYTGIHCETDIDECKSSPCLNEAECIDGIGEYSCTCKNGYSGTQCETNIDECQSSPCQNEAKCIDDVNRYSCSCKAGFSGIHCETNIDECHSSPCQNDAECVDGINRYSCTCEDGYTGIHCETDIDECKSSPCLNEAECIDGIGEYSCTCKNGYSGTQCETNIDECQSSPCQNEAECIDDVNRYSCLCKAGFSGIHCKTNIDECHSSPCQNDAECVDGINRYSCTCKDGYTGIHCETDISECQTNPCQNDAECIDDVNQYSCKCKAGFVGSHCETNIDECQSNPCQNGAECVDDVNQYSCTCKDGFMGIHCDKDIDECQSSPCQNDAECVDEVNQYTCICKDGSTGSHCETDFYINECLSTPCMIEGTCIDGVNEYKCICKNGYTGAQCETDIDECLSGPCLNEAECIDGVNQYSCSCKAGFAGKHCDTEIDECLSSPCENKAECIDEVNQYSCVCKAGFTGKHCETDINECQSNPCQNEGECHDDIYQYTCICKAGYEGIHCETVTSVPVRRTSMQFVFEIDVSDIDLSGNEIRTSVSDEISRYFTEMVGESFRRIVHILLRFGSLVVDLEAELEDKEIVVSDFAKANFDLISGEKTIEILNKSMSPSLITVGNMTVSSENSSTENMICEIFLEINGKCPAEEHCASDTRTPKCEMKSENYGLTFVVVMIVCSNAAVILIIFIICFPIRGYRLRNQKPQTGHFLGSELKRRALDEKEAWPYHRTELPYSLPWGTKNNARGFLFNRGHTEAEVNRNTSEKIRKGKKDDRKPNVPKFISHRHNLI